MLWVYVNNILAGTKEIYRCIAWVLKGSVDKTW